MKMRLISTKMTKIFLEDCMKTILSLAAISIMAISASADGAALYKKCVACHGAQGEKKALGNKSGIIKDMTKDNFIASLKGYKEGKGGPMKAMMKGQVASLSDAQIEEIANYIVK